ncbi:phage tail assembly protein [Lysinibacillus capsici]|uniref:phage tail assembly protein n=1 Tax=Lysinibacillus capsici TaxID=2115968 RepID=UPI0036794630
MKNEQQNEQVLGENHGVVTNQGETNPNIITVPIKKPIEINGEKVNELILDFTDLTGKDILKIDTELRMDGRPGGFDSIYNQDAMLKLAARGIGCIPPDLEKLHGADFFELLLQVRNFFIQW